MTSTNELRRTFLEYFRERGHEVVPTSPLVPGNDPTLLFTNAGMVQFKDVFLGADRRAYSRAVTAQRCVRAGGKHNDLDNVGYTARHHTFFEMLGNFSFGDYFKREAIGYCWELMTERLGLPAEKLWVTVYEDDDEAADIWLKEIGVDPRRFTRCGEKDNFWSMGDTGPCGPCSEVFYDHGPEVWGGPPGTPEEDGDRYVELWNLVFMQYDRAADGTMTPLPAPSVDTGMGLERTAAVMQGVHSNYDIDLFSGLIDAAVEITGARDRESSSLRVIADHIRSSAFMVCDGVAPSRDGRGYVLRRIIRRALRHGHKLGVEGPFFHRLVGALEAQMGEAYPELGRRREQIERVLRKEEEQFAYTLDHGMRHFDDAVSRMSGDTLDGETVFKLYDTYGFPDDLTADMARERGIKVDVAGFAALLEQRREASREGGKFRVDQGRGPAVDVETEFNGYASLDGDGKVLAVLSEGVVVESLGPEDDGVILMDRTPFYAESGGQVGDRGLLRSKSARFEVSDTQKYGDGFAHIGVVTEGEIRVGDDLVAEVEVGTRSSTARNHSATHLLHAALRKVLGDHVQQKGSLVAPDRLRFDFSHFEPVTPDQCAEIERCVNEWIIANYESETRVMPLEEAKASGAVALFGEKYDDPVRVLSLGPESTELCGGTHVRRTGDVGLFKLLSESGIGGGVRRVEAVTGLGAFDWLSELEHRVARTASALKAGDRTQIAERAAQVVGQRDELEKELERLKSRLASSQGEELASQAVEIDGLKVLAARIEGIDKKGLPDTIDHLKNKLGTAAVVLACVSGDKVNLAAGVTADSTDRIQAGPLVNFVAQQVGGRGGGRPDLAQAGGSDVAKLDQAIGSVANWVREQLGQG